MNSKKLLALVFVMMVASLILTACGSEEVEVTRVVTEKETVIQKETVVQEKEVVVTATAVPAGERPKMSFWMNKNFDEAVNVLIESQVQEWAKANNVDIDILLDDDANLITKWSAGMEAPETLPDVSVIFYQWAPRFYDADLLLDVSDAFAASNSLAGGFFPAAQDVSTFEGKQLTVPYIGSVTPAYWRTDKLAEAGLSEPPATYEEMKDFCAKVNTDDFWCYGFAFSGVSDVEVQMQSLIWSYGGTLNDETGKVVTINSPETLAVLEWIKEMNDMGSFPPDAIVQDDMGNNLYYQSGSVATVVNTGSILAYLINNDEDLLSKTILTPSPGGPAGIYAGGGFGATLGAFNTTKYPELAKSLIEWFTHPDRVWARSKAVKFGNLPVHVDAAKDPVWEDPHLKPFIDQLQYAHPRCYPGPATSACVIVQGDNVLARMAQRVLDGSQTPQESLDQAEQEMIKIYTDNPPK